jgi:membrane glycosyltransferase
MDALTAAVERDHWAALPNEAPLDMPVQSLRVRADARHEPARLPSAPHGMALRRLLVIGGAVERWL